MTFAKSVTTLAVRPTGSTDRDLDDASAAGQAASRALKNCKLADGVLVTAGTFAVGETKTLKHGLNRQLRGVLPTLGTNYAEFRVVSATSNTIQVQSSTDVDQVTFWCF